MTDCIMYPTYWRGEVGEPEVDRDVQPQCVSVSFSVSFCSLRTGLDLVVPEGGQVEGLSGLEHHSQRVCTSIQRVAVPVGLVHIHTRAEHEGPVVRYA